jgi:peptidoglycan hydrolase CwlO-like protein/ribosomal protein L31
MDITICNHMNQRTLLASVALLVILAAALSVFAYNQSNQIVNLDNDLSDAETQNAILAGEKSDLANEKAALIANVSSLQQQIAETGGRIDTLTQQIDEMKAESADLESTNDDLRGNVERQQATITSLRNELNDAQSEISDLNDQINGYLAQIAAMNAPIDERHLNSTLLAQQDCSQCHGEVAELASRNESNSYHNTHFNNPLLNFECTDCHKSVGISSTSENITSLVDIKICEECHTTFPTKVYMSQVTPPDRFALLFPDCIRCHDDWQDDMEDASFVALDKVTVSDCTTCHLNNALFPNPPRQIEIPCNFCH